MTALPVLETKRLILRLPEIKEAVTIIEFYRKNETHLTPWEPLKNENYYTISFWQKIILRMRRECLKKQSLRLNLYEKSTQTLVGMANFTNFERGAFQSCRLGYKLGQAYEGQGFMYESLQAAIAYIFHQLNFHRIEANYLPHNERSANLLKRLGFQIRGKEDNYLRINGRWETHILTSLLNPAWQDSFANQTHQSVTVGSFCFNTLFK